MQGKLTIQPESSVVPVWKLLLCMCCMHTRSCYLSSDMTTSTSIQLRHAALCLSCCSPPTARHHQIEELLMVSRQGLLSSHSSSRHQTPADVRPLQSTALHIGRSA
jgi:hypothetical protein